MPEMIIYLLKVNTALLLFYGGYRFILQQYTFHQLNRIYLLTGLIFSALYPFINISGFLTRNQRLKEKIGAISPDWQSSVTYVFTKAEDAGVNYWGAVLVVFWIGVAVMAIRLIIQMISLLILHTRSTSLPLNNLKIRRVSESINPFSFWRTIYLNPERHEANELRSILEHEQIHVKQLHTLDVMLAEISTIFYWFNPGVWLMKKAVKANLEYITDQEVIMSGVDSKEYQYALLKINVLPQNALPVTNFHFLTIKKRIAMMNKKPSNEIKKSGYLIILPAIILVLVILTSSGAIAVNGDNSIVKILGDLPVKLQSENRSLQTPVLQESKLINAQSSVINNDTIVPKAIVTSGKVSDDSTKGEIIPSHVKTKESGILDIKRIVRTDTITDSKKQPLYYIDGVKVETMQDVRVKVNPENILSINVLKGASATSVYGAEAVNGVIDIKTNVAGNTTRTNGTGTVTVVGYPKGQKVSLDNIGNELIIIDDKESTKTALYDLSVGSIATIDIRKGPEAVTQYGEKAKDGVVVVRTKK